jgi:hypothetical protein
MRRLALMKITTTNATQIRRVLFAYPQAADRSLDVSVRGGFSDSMNASASSTASVSKDVSDLRSRRPPV